MNNEYLPELWHPALGVHVFKSFSLSNSLPNEKILIFAEAKNSPEAITFPRFCICLLLSAQIISSPRNLVVFSIEPVTHL